jgi:hypothetical protein
VHGNLPVSVSLAAGAAVRDRQVVMDHRIARLQLRGCFERRDRFGCAPAGDERPAQPDEGVPESGIQFACAREVLDRLGPLVGLPRQFSQNVLRSGIRRIDLQFLLELAVRVFSRGGSLGLGKDQLAETVMDTGQPRVLREHVAVLGCGFLPSALCFEGFGTPPDQD